MSSQYFSVPERSLLSLPQSSLEAHEKGWDRSLNKLTMSLNGVIDAEVRAAITRLGVIMFIYFA